MMPSRDATKSLLQRVLISDRKRHASESFVVDLAGQARLLGATAVMLREKDLDTQAVITLAEQIQAAVQLPLLIAHDEVAAMAVRAAGVHLGGTSSSVEQARDRMGEGPLIGASVHSVEEGQAAASRGADYLMLGAIQATIKAHGPYPVLGFEPLAALCRSVACPVIAVGGMNPQHEQHVRSLGAAGWAAIRAFSKSGNDS